jgi:AraC-like DNA-binding protein
MTILGKLKMENTFYSYAGSDVFKTIAASHVHRGAELLYIVSGKCIMEFSDGEVLTGTPGCVFIIPPLVFHERRIVSECKTFYVVFEKNDDAFLRSSHVVNIGKDDLIPQWFENLELLNREYDTAQANGILYALLQRLKKIEHSNKYAENLHPSVIKVRELIQNNYSQPLTVSDLAQQAGISQSHLNMLFRQQTGHGVLHALIECRMKNARLLLQNYYYNISEVAVMCGIPDLAYFSHCFRRYYGVTPGKFRSNPENFTRNQPPDNSFRPLQNDLNIKKQLKK